MADSVVRLDRQLRYQGTILKIYEGILGFYSSRWSGGGFAGHRRWEDSYGASVPQCS